MARKRIPKKEWAVLTHFIVKESEMIEKFLLKSNQASPEGPDPFLTYPGKIESCITDMSRVTANKACKNFLNMGILEVPKSYYTHKRGRKSDYYSLKSDLNTIRKLVQLVLEYLPYPEAQELLDNYYFTYNLNESLVREVLNEKGVCISRSFSIVDWDVEDAQRIIDIENVNSKYEEDKIDFSNLVKDVVSEYEQNNKKNEVRYVNRLKNFCKQFYKDCKNPNFDEIQYYFKEYDLINIIWSKNNDLSSSKDSFVHWGEFAYLPLNLKLPIFDGSFTEKKNIEKIKELNIETLYYAFYGDSYYLQTTIPGSLKSYIPSIISDLDDLRNDICCYSPEKLNSLEILINNLNDFIENFDQKYKTSLANHNFSYLVNDLEIIFSQVIDFLNSVKEKNAENIIGRRQDNIQRVFDPIKKQLEKVSTIKELKTQSIQNNYYNLLKDHYDTFEYEKLILPLLALIQASPLALNEFLNGEWEPFELSFSEWDGAKNNEFLTKFIHIAFLDLVSRPHVLTKGIVDGVSFNSYCPSNANHHEIVGLEDLNKCAECISNLMCEYFEELSYERWNISEGTSLKIRLKQIYELTFYLSFNVSTKQDISKISSSFSLDIIPDIDYYLFRIRSLKNPESLISKLRSKDETYNHIRGLLSRKIQNIIMHCDLSTTPSLKLKEDLLKELNFLLLKSELYRKGIFDNLAMKDEKVREAIQDLSTNNVYLKDLIQMIHEEPLYNLRRGLLTDNKRVLEKVFEDEFEQNNPF